MSLYWSISEARSVLLFQQKFRFGIGSSQIKTKDTTLTISKITPLTEMVTSLGMSEKTGFFQRADSDLHCWQIKIRTLLGGSFSSTGFIT